MPLELKLKLNLKKKSIHIICIATVFWDTCKGLRNYLFCVVLQNRTRNILCLNTQICISWLPFTCRYNINVTQTLYWL